MWRLDTRCDRIVSSAEYDSMPPSLQDELFEHHATIYGGLLILYGDDARFFNHSIKPNVFTHSPISDMVAHRKIVVGEEILVDYFTISDAAYET